VSLYSSREKQNDDFKCVTYWYHQLRGLHNVGEWLWSIAIVDSRDTGRKETCAIVTLSTAWKNNDYWIRFFYYLVLIWHLSGPSQRHWNAVFGNGLCGMSHKALQTLWMCRNTRCGFGGLEVACWPLVPKFACSNLAEAVGFFGRKNPQRAFLRRGSKAVCPMSCFTACKRNQKWRGSRHSRQNFSAIPRP
jgi:hypothetical protein